MVIFFLQVHIKCHFLDIKPLKAGILVTLQVSAGFIVIRRIQNYMGNSRILQYDTDANKFNNREIFVQY